MSRIFITGDTHGDHDINKLTSHHFRVSNKLTRDDYVIICGDAAIVWDGDRFDKYIQDWYNSKPWTTLYVLGNHENYEKLEDYPIIEWHGGRVRKISDAIFVLLNGEYYTIEDKTFFTFGGAVSQDKMFRKEHTSWWSQEIPSIEEFRHGLDTLAEHGNKVDYILSHDAPDFVLDQMGYEHNIVSNYLEIIRDTTTYSKWCFGHHHRDQNFPNNFYAFYKDVCELVDDYFIRVVQ